MADINSLLAKTRIELGDNGTSFVATFITDGRTNRYLLHHSPLDGGSVQVFANGIDITHFSAVEESTGTLVMDITPGDFPTLITDPQHAVPDAGIQVIVSGTQFRYFTTTELTSIVNDAFLQHNAHAADAMGRKKTLANLPAIEEQPVAVYASTLALYILATDASFDIDISAPDGVTIPRAERFRQLSEMIAQRQAQYRDLCAQLGIGMYRIEVETLNRISKTTNRLIPVYRPQEVDDRSYPQRVRVDQPTLGDDSPEWDKAGTELTAYQGQAFSATIPLPDSDYTGKTLEAGLYYQRGSYQLLQQFGLSVIKDANGVYQATLTLTAAQTHLMLPERLYYVVTATDNATNEVVEVVSANFYTVRSYQVIL